VTESALVTQPSIATALRQAGSTGRHRRKSHGAGWTIPRQYAESQAATGRTTPRHRKPPQAAASRSTPRHRKTPQAAASRPTPRHRKKGPGNIQASYPSFRIGQDNSIRLATRRAALPGALAIGLLAIGGAITGAFTTPLPGIDRGDASGPGGMASASIPPPPALTAMSTPSPTLPARADRGLRGPVDASASAAWPISEQAGTAGASGNVDTRQPAPTGSTTIVRDRAPEPVVFAPTVTADPPSGHGGGGGPAESSVQAEPPGAGGGALSDMFGPGGLLNGLAGGPGDYGTQGADRGDGPQGRGSGTGGDGNTSPDSEGSDRPGRVGRPGSDRDTGGRGSAGRGFGRPGETGEAGRPGHRGSDGQSGGGGQHRRGGGGQ
jgi:hypothetical protein